MGFFLWCEEGGQRGRSDLFRGGARSPRSAVGPRGRGRVALRGDCGSWNRGDWSTEGGGGRSDVFRGRGSSSPVAASWNIWVAVRPPWGWKRCPRGPRSSVPERNGLALCWSHVPDPRPSTSGRFDRTGRGLRAPGRGRGCGAARKYSEAGPASPFRCGWPGPLGRFRGRVRPPGGLHVWGPPCVGGASGPPGLIPGRGPRARRANLPAERGGA